MFCMWHEARCQHGVVAQQRGDWSAGGRKNLCAAREDRPDLAVHACGHAVAHQSLLFSAGNSNHELAEIVDTARSQRAPTDSSFSLNDLAS